MTQEGIRGLLTTLTALLALLAAVVLPGGYYLMAYSSLEAAVEATTRSEGFAITRIINRSPETWQYQEHLLRELLIYRTDDKGEAAQVVRIVATGGRVILETGEPPPRPRVTRTVDLLDSGEVIASVETTTTLRQLLARTALIAVLGLALGLAIFVAIRWLPMRAVERAFGQAQRDAESAQTALAEANHEALRADAELKRRVGAETELKRSYERIDFLLCATPAVIYSARPDRDYAVTFMSANVRAALGYDPEEFTADPGFWSSNIHPDDRERVFAGLAELGRADKHVYEYRYRHQNGSWRWMQDEFTLIRDSSGAPQELIGYWIDVTERHRAQAAVAEALHAKTEFMNYVTHELRTPLNSVIGFAELLKDEVPGPLNARQAAFAADILASGERLLALVEGILEMSRLDAAETLLEREPVEIGAVLAERVAAHRKAAEARGVILRLEVAPELGSAEMSPKALRRMLDALIDNAIKFNRDGGSMAVSARRAGGALEIAVADTGIGIAHENLEKLFRPLEQLDAGLARRFGGIGLGLTLARRLAELHGGTLGVESEPGKGSTFTLRLPTGAKP